MNGQISRWSDLPLVLTAAEAAQVLRLDRRTVTNLLCKGRLRGIKTGRDWRISRAVLMRFVGDTSEDGGSPRSGTAEAQEVAMSASETDPWERGDLLKLAGIAAGGPADLSSDKYKYFGEIYADAAA